MALALALVGLGGAVACNGSVSIPSVSPSPIVTKAPRTPAPSVIDPTLSTYQPEPGADGGSVMIGDWQEAFQFNPYYLGAGAEPAVASAAWAGLVTLTRDRRYVPELAAVIPTLDNGRLLVPGDGGDAMTATWTLRDGLKWSDGEPLTCDDFKYTWQWVLDKANYGVVTAGFEDFKDLECKSDTEMLWHFGSIYEGYLGLMKAPLPRHYLASIPMDQQTQGVGFRAEDIAKLPVSGPFRFESATFGVELRMARNTNYSSPLTGKPAHLDSLTFRWFGDAKMLIEAYRAGQVDIAMGLGDDDAASLGSLRDEAATQSSLTYETLRPNWSEELCSTNAAVAGRGVGCPLADPAVRTAVAAAIDRTAIPKPSATDAIPNTNVDPLAWFYAARATPAFDPERARTVLDEAGWRDGDGDGVREKEGLEARVEICTTARQARLDTAALVESWLKDVGIDAVLTEAKPADMFAAYDESSGSTPCALQRGNFDLALHSMGSSVDPGDYYFNYHSSQFAPDGANDARVNDAGIDVALETVKDSVNTAVIKDAMAEYQSVFIDRTVEIPLYFGHTFELHVPRVGNFDGAAPTGGATWNVADWFIRR